MCHSICCVASDRLYVLITANVSRVSATSLYGAVPDARYSVDHLCPEWQAMVLSDCLPLRMEAGELLTPRM